VSRLVLRALAFLGPVVALLTTGAAGRTAPWWLILLVLVLAGATAAAPDSAIGAGTGLVVLGWWVIAVDAVLPGEVVVAGVALAVGHLAATVASYGPGTMPLDAPTLLLWTRRGALVLLTVPGAWVLARAVQDEPEQPGLWVLALGVACLGIIGATVAIGVEEEP
jgi:hypothetical protein